MNQNKYHRIATDLTERITSGEFQAGSKLPSEKQLCNDYDVNRNTLRKAIQQLANSSYVEVKRGVGTFVTPKRWTYHMGPLCQFTQTMLTNNKLQSQNIVIESHEITPLQEISEKLGIEPGQKVYMIKRLTMLDQTPYTLTTSYFSAERFPHLTKFIKDGVSLSKVLREQYKVNQRRVSSTFSVVMPKQEHLNLLKIDVAVPILNVRNRSKDENGDVVEYNISDYRGDFASIEVEYQ